MEDEIEVGHVRESNNLQTFFDYSGCSGSIDDVLQVCHKELTPD
jgi:hypothetical protein